jgi:hypothetical protein
MFKPTRSLARTPKRPRHRFRGCLPFLRVIGILVFCFITIVSRAQTNTPAAHDAEAKLIEAHRLRIMAEESARANEAAQKEAGLRQLKQDELKLQEAMAAEKAAVEQVRIHRATQEAARRQREEDERRIQQEIQAQKAAVEEARIARATPDAAAAGQAGSTGSREAEGAASETNRMSRAQANELLLDLLVKKGLVTQDEAGQLKNESELLRSNNADASFPKWSIGSGIKSVELFGDIKFRFEDRDVRTPVGGGIDLDRYRYALRLGLRGDAAANFYYGVRLETSSNPRSPWVTFATSSTGTPYQGPFGKGAAGINLGQIYLGWRSPNSNVDLTMGKMPMPLYTTAMVWDSDICPEGAAERFKYNIGPAEFFANFAQFIYQDGNPSSATPFLLGLNDPGNSANSPFLMALQGGVNYQIAKDVSFKAGATLYNYLGHGTTNTSGSVSATNTPGFSGVYVGEGAGGVVPGFPYPGASGYPSSVNDGFYYNQTGVNNLLVLELPFEVNFKLLKHRFKVFGDFAENLEGTQRAEAAVAAADNPLIYATPLKIPLQKDQNKAYQLGLAFGNGDALGQVYGSALRRGAWEARFYYQHIEQYSLDPNLLDSDFFEGAANMQGIYAAFAYCFSDAVVGTVRYGYASRIDNRLGTGGSDQDIPQINPIDQYQLMQADLSLKF